MGGPFARPYQAGSNGWNDSHTAALGLSNSTSQRCAMPSREGGGCTDSGSAAKRLVELDSSTRICAGSRVQTASAVPRPQAAQRGVLGVHAVHGRSVR